MLPVGTHSIGFITSAACDATKVHYYASVLIVVFVASPYPYFCVIARKYTLKPLSHEPLQIALPLLPQADAYSRISCVTSLRVCVRSSKCAPRRSRRQSCGSSARFFSEIRQPRGFLLLSARPREDTADQSTGTRRCSSKAAVWALACASSRTENIHIFKKT